MSLTSGPPHPYFQVEWEKLEAEEGGAGWVKEDGEEGAGGGGGGGGGAKAGEEADEDWEDV